MSRGYVRVEIDDRIPQWGDALERAIIDALEEYKPVLVGVAKAKETAIRTGALNSEVDGLSVDKTSFGFQSGVGDSNWKANWFEKGTHAHSNQPGIRGVFSITPKGNRRRKKLKRDSDIISGVRALHYLKDALYSTFPAFISILGEHMDRARP